jgi:hypothetical protein
MAAFVRRRVRSINDGLGAPREQALRSWGHRHWAREIDYGYDYYRPGSYKLLMDLQRADSPLARPPFVRDSEFVRNFADTFLVAKFADYGVVIHTGRLSRWKGISGFGGGALSAFWTRDAGPAILGRNRNRPYPVPQRDTWKAWRQWNTHATSGETPDGKAFSTARVRKPEAAYKVADRRAEIEVTGSIGAKHDEGLSCEDGCITGKVSYTRKFTASEKGLTVETRLSSDGADRVRDLYEIIPVFLPDPAKAAAGKAPERPLRIIFVRGDEAKEATSEPADGVTAIRIERYEGTIEIGLDRPRLVRMAPPQKDPEPDPPRACRNIMIDLLEGRDRPCALPSLVIRYNIRPQGKKSSARDAAPPAADNARPGGKGARRPSRKPVWKSQLSPAHRWPPNVRLSRILDLRSADSGRD